MIGSAPLGLWLVESLAPGWVAYVDADWIPGWDSQPSVALLRGPNGTLTFAGSTVAAPDVSADQAAAVVLEAVARAVVEIAAACDAETVDVVGRGLIASRIRTALSAVGGAGPVDVVVDATGDPTNIRDALVRLRDHGTLVLAGQSGRMSLDLYPDVHRRGLNLIGAPHPLDAIAETWTPVPSFEPPTSISLGEPPPPGARWYRVRG